MKEVVQTVKIYIEWDRNIDKNQKINVYSIKCIIIISIKKVQIKKKYIFLQHYHNQYKDLCTRILQIVLSEVMKYILGWLSGVLIKSIPGRLSESDWNFLQLG